MILRAYLTKLRHYLLKLLKGVALDVLNENAAKFGNIIANHIDDTTWILKKLSINDRLYRRPGHRFGRIDRIDRAMLAPILERTIDDFITMEHIRELLSTEGAQVWLSNERTEQTLSEAIVQVQGAWTNWEREAFYSPSIANALAMAVNSYRRRILTP